MQTEQTEYFPVLSSLVAGELARMRHCSTIEIEACGITQSTEIGNGDLGTTSLELLELASAVDQMFHLQETGTEEYLLRYRKLADWAEIVSVSLKKRPENITFSTSGTTGKRRPCTHLTGDLHQEVNVHAESHRGCGRVLSLVPTHHIYGFIWAFLLPRRLAIDVVDVRRWPASKLAKELRATDLLIGTPAIWRRLSEALETFVPPVSGIVSGAPCPAWLFRRLQTQHVELTEVYGSSETAGVGRRQSPDQPYELFPFWSRSASLTSLSRNNAGKAGTHEVEVVDQLEWLEPRRFFVRERKDGAVQVFGVNVYPESVAESIRAHTRVRDCAVRLMKPEEGDRLKAFIVFRDGPPAPGDLSELQAWLCSRLQPQERPGNIVFGSELPQNEMGKAADWKCLK